ncbi:squalene/phytoene synthase family protein [Candidatus Nomurabacteria bacterium]|nr:squalene/phytoene synthase family protein [Candidatus Nomurabacteria bacterium]
MRYFDHLRNFYRGSRKYFMSAIFLPDHKRQELSIVYQFFRKIDDKIDENEWGTHDLEKFIERFFSHWNTGKSMGDPDLDQFLILARSHKFKQDWIKAFLGSMRMDLEKHQFLDLDDTMRYTYGVAEVVGLTVCRLFELKNDCFEYARSAGRAAQWANFIRDFRSDLEMGRLYFPNSDLTKLNLPTDHESLLALDATDLKELFDMQIARYYKYYEYSTKGYRFLPWGLRMATDFSHRADQRLLRKIEAETSKPGRTVYVKQYLKVRELLSELVSSLKYLKR